MALCESVYQGGVVKSCFRVLAVGRYMIRGDIGVLSVIKVCRVVVFVSRRVAGDWSLEHGRSEPS